MMNAYQKKLLFAELVVTIVNKEQYNLDYKLVVVLSQKFFILYVMAAELVIPYVLLSQFKLRSLHE